MNPDEPEEPPAPLPTPDSAEKRPAFPEDREFDEAEREPVSKFREPAREQQRSFAPWAPQHRRGSFSGSEFAPMAWWRSAMSLIPKRTRKALRKTVRRTIRRHGPEFAAAIATGVVSSLLAATNIQGKKKKKKKKR